GAGLPEMTAPQPMLLYLTPHNPNVGAGLPAIAACQPTPIYLTPRNQTVGAGLLAKTAWQSTQLDCVHIHCCGNGHLGFRPDGGSLCKSRDAGPGQSKQNALAPPLGAPPNPCRIPASVV
ncbi:hypothetical protein CER19_15925, partial [Pseudomonas sp. GL93]